MSEAHTVSPHASGGDVEYVDPERLEPHELNDEIYVAERGVKELVKRIERDGFADYEPLLVTEDDTILGGHRRWRAAREVGVETVPVVRVDPDTETDAKRILLTDNEYRDKTPAEKVNEAEQWETIEREKAKERMSEGGEVGGSKGSQNLDTPSDTGRTDEKVAEKVGVSKDTYRKGKRVKDIAVGREDAPEEVREVAEEQWAAMQSGEQSFHGAKTAVGAVEEFVEEATETVEQSDSEDVEDEFERQVEQLREGEIDVETAVKSVERERVRSEHEVEETPDLPDGEYTVLLADPPWNYDFSEARNREIENHYATMDTSDIAALDVPAADSAVLYLWATAPKLCEALEVLDSWGFEYRTNAVWDKQKIGMGYWFRGQHELLLVGVKGDVSPPETEDRVSSVIESPRTQHSEKPSDVYEIIEQAFPLQPKVELFAREEREGWDTWGDEVA